MCAGIHMYGVIYIIVFLRSTLCFTALLVNHTSASFVAAFQLNRCVHIRNIYISCNALMFVQDTKMATKSDCFII